MSSLFVAFVLLTGCDLSYTVGQLFIRNESGQSLYVESNIVSEHTSETCCFLLEVGDEARLGKSPRYDGHASYLPLSHCVYNDDAYVSIFTIDDNEEKHLARTWYYSDRDKDGKQLFNENYLDKDFSDSPDGGNFPCFVFVVLPEDLESN